jgi:putative selenium metabolism hydrolase
MTAVPSLDYDAIRERAAHYEEAMTRFLRDMVAIPSESAEERDVIDRIRQEMEAVGFDEVRVDGLGNVLGRIGSGKHVIAMDAHIDTVGVGDPGNWDHDPYQGKLEDGVIYGRGASDQEGGMASMVYGARIIKDLDLEGDYTLWVTGTVMEEDCDGLCWQYLLKEKVLEPEVVVITEPTNLDVYRGHRGRMELEIRTQGKSAHGAMPQLGDNAVYKMAAIIADIERLDTKLAETADPFLGKGTCTISHVRSTSPSLCAVADSCTIHVDRRLTVGEDEAHVVAELSALPGVAAAGAEITVLDYAREAYTGLTYPTKKYYPTWVIDEGAPLARAAMATAEGVLGRAPKLSRWNFSTNGVATMGMFGIPTVGFGPGNEIYAHTNEDQCPVEHLRLAAAFYAAFPQMYLATAQGE